MKHHVRTNAGKSAEFYQHGKAYMKGEEGQGKTSSTPNWLFTSSTLLNALEEQCTGLYLPSVDGKYVSVCIAEGFVDDTDAGTANQRTQTTDTPEILAEKMCVIAQTWADLIHGSGGKVSLPKSCWLLVWLNWNAGKASLDTIDEVAAQIKLTNGKTQEAKALQRKNPSESVRQLGLLNDLEGTPQDN
eukprot:2657244-Ditylum_brightwellii.AAC.1